MKTIFYLVFSFFLWKDSMCWPDRPLLLLVQHGMTGTLSLNICPADAHSFKYRISHSVFAQKRDTHVSDKRNNTAARCQWRGMLVLGVTFSITRWLSHRQMSIRFKAKTLTALFLCREKMQLQVGNLRSNGENGSTVRSPNQDSVIGQISVWSVSCLSVCPASITFSSNFLVCWKPNLWHKCSFSSPNSSITVLSLLAILQCADRSEDQIWQMRVSAECGGHAISKQTRKTLNSVSVCFSSMSLFFTCSLNITFGDYLMGILLYNLLILTDPCTDSFACMGSSNQELIHVGDEAPSRTRSQEARITTGEIVWIWSLSQSKTPWHLLRGFLGLLTCIFWDGTGTFVPSLRFTWSHIEFDPPVQAKILQDGWTGTLWLPDLNKSFKLVSWSRAKECLLFWLRSI